MRLPAVLLALAIVLASCTGDGGEPQASPSPGRPPQAMLIAENLTLFPGDAFALRLGFDPFEPAARLTIRYQPTDAVIDACPLADPAAQVPGRGACERDMRDGVREPIVSAGMRALAIVLRSDRAVDLRVVLEFDERSRAITLALPVLRAPPGNRDCSDNGCNPFLELVPTRAGPFTASARWSGGADATLILLQGRVLARSLTATGVPYGEPARADGASPLRIGTTMSAPAEYALALRHGASGAGSPPLTDVLIEAAWPPSARSS